MAYTVTNTDGSVVAVIEDKVIDTNYTLKLLGRDVSGYGAAVAENTLRHLENFASSTAPSGTKLIGQLWYDKSEGLFKVWNGTGWNRSTNIVVDDSAPTTSLVAGAAWFDTRTDKLKVHDGSTFKLTGYAGEVSNAYASSSDNGNPSNYGTKLRNIFLTASDDSVKPVLALVHVSDGTVNQGVTSTVNGKETVIAVLSDHAAFSIKNSVSSSEGESINYYPEFSASSGIGTTINPGLNLRGEYDSTALALASRALRADASYVLNTGSPGADSSNISASDVIHTSRSYVPTAGNTYFLGSVGRAFARLNVNQIVLGSGGASEMQANGTVSIGNATTAINNIYGDTIQVNDTLVFSTANLASSGSRALNGWFTNLDTTTLTINDYGMPAADGTNGQALVTDGNGTVSFQSLAGDISAVTAGAGLTGGGSSGSVNLDIGAGTYMIVNADNIAVDATSTNTASKVVARDASGNFAAGVITATATQARYADLAEIYLPDQEYPAGTVVKIGGEFEITATEFDMDEVFGVISTDPAFLMNNDSPGLPVALAGRVLVRLDGAVTKGQRIVPSDIPGVARALLPTEEPVSVIGRSLETKQTLGEGLVEAVVLASK